MKGLLLGETLLEGVDGMTITYKSNFNSRGPGSVTVCLRPEGTLLFPHSFYPLIGIRSP